MKLAPFRIHTQLQLGEVATRRPLRRIVKLRAIYVTNSAGGVCGTLGTQLKLGVNPVSMKKNARLGGPDDCLFTGDY